jgi:hypothetical protein
MSTGGEITRGARKAGKARVLDHVQAELGAILAAPMLDRNRLQTLLNAIQAKSIGDVITNADTLERRSADDYQTDPRLVAAFFKLAPTLLYHDNVCFALDLGAGVGVWGRALQLFFQERKLAEPLQTGIDIQPNLMPPSVYGRRFHIDFLDPNLRLPEDPETGGAGYDLIGWNVPYGDERHRDLITQFLFRAYQLIPKRGPAEIWSLCRLNWLGGKDRAATIFGDSNPAGVPWREDLVILSTRPTFYYPLEAANAWSGGTLDDVYGGRTYPTDYALVRFAFEDRRPVGTKSVLHRLVYDKRKPKKAKQSPKQKVFAPVSQS